MIILSTAERRWLREQIRFYGRRAPWVRWMHRVLHDPKTERAELDDDGMDWTEVLAIQTWGWE